MAFETITTETTETRYSYRDSLIVTSIFLFIVILLWAFHSQVHAWWTNLANRRLAADTVELPQPLVAQPATTPAPTPTPVPSLLPAAPTPTPYVPVATKPTPPNTKLPHTGPAEDVAIYLLLSGGLSVLPIEHTLRKRKLRRALKNLEILQ